MRRSDAIPGDSANELRQLERPPEARVRPHRAIGRELTRPDFGSCIARCRHGGTVPLQRLASAIQRRLDGDRHNSIPLDLRGHTPFEVMVWMKDGAGCVTTHHRIDDYRSTA
jgi:hypothetical protein